MGRILGLPIQRVLAMAPRICLLSAMSTALVECIYVCWLRFDCFTSHLQLLLEIRIESAAKSRNLPIDLDRELIECYKPF
jgi:hypothetical protein